MKQLLASLLLAPALLLASPAPATAPATAPAPRPATAVTADPPTTPREAVDYAVYYLGAAPCVATYVALGYPTVTAPQQYVHDQLALVGYDFPVPGLQETFFCPY